MLDITRNINNKFLNPTSNNVGSFGIKNKQNATLTQKPENIVPSNFNNFQGYAVSFRSSINDKETMQKYNEISQNLDNEDKIALSNLLKTGVLLNKNSNDGSSVLDNLHKMASTPRLQGLEKEKLLKDVITAISNPYTITQKFGDVPSDIATKILDADLGVETKSELDVQSSSCVATSIQFNLAQKMPAEYARMAEGLSSEKYCVEKNMKLSDICDKPDDAKWLLNEFKIPHAIDEDNNLKVLIQPDRNAVIRARIQTSFKDDWERSPIDVLIQSAFMNIGSQQSYNSLNDTRDASDFNSEITGLTEIEKTFTEQIAEGRQKETITYQIIDNNGKLAGYNIDNETLKYHLTSALDAGDNVIVGFLITDDNNNITGGHEITITGHETDTDGKLLFICNDTDDGLSEPVQIDANVLLPRIHHAGYSKEVYNNF